MSSVTSGLSTNIHASKRNRGGEGCREGEREREGARKHGERQGDGRVRERERKGEERVISSLKCIVLISNVSLSLTSTLTIMVKSHWLNFKMSNHILSLLACVMREQKTINTGITALYVLVSLLRRQVHNRHILLVSFSR